MKLAVPDIISNSYFPAAAAIELGFFREEGLDVSLELIFPVDKAYAALRDGAVDFVGGSAHSALAAFPEWRGVKLLCAQGARHVLVSGHARRSESAARRYFRGQGQEHRCGALGRHGASPFAARSGNRFCARRCQNRTGAGRSRGGRQFRRHRGQSAGRAKDRRFLGQRHGRGSCGAPWRGHCGAGRAARRWAQIVLQLYDGLHRHDGCADRARPPMWRPPPCAPS